MRRRRRRTYPTLIRGLIQVSNFFTYRHGELFAEEVPVARVAAAVDTPFYLYSAAAFTAQYREFADAFLPEEPLICYAVKANSNLAVLRIFADLGAGADVVSEGELRRALAARVPPERIIFSGVGKTAAEIAAAVAAGIHQINVESIPELRRVSEVASAQGQVARIAIRVNPDVDAHTHAKISTGRKENKFGVEFGETVSAYNLASQLPGVEPIGLAVHIGSQVTDIEPYRRAFERLAELVRELRGLGFPVARMDLGGGIGVRYDAERPPEPLNYAKLVRDIFGPLGLALAFEPGRVLTAPAGLLVTKVVYVKEGSARRFVIVDAAMNDLIRPALYDAWHDIVPVRLPEKGAALAPADVVGPVCETGDTFAVDRQLPLFAEGDILAFADAGAYGAVMSTTYNSRLLVPEVLVSHEHFAVVRARPSYEALLSLDTIPEWLCQRSPDRSANPVRKRGAA
ncbi:MAG: diaminopimelate decarboxylase [Alphaproteobacteria bacterium]|nr:diaminopimelate decarboxylase [Alphaproteobacteria bacterium]